VIHSELLNHRFERLVVLSIHKASDVGKNRKDYFAKCKCDCGSERYVRIYSLKTGETKSCGCLQRDTTRVTFQKHGDCKSRLYKLWHGMLTRCRDMTGQYYQRYGGRGISFCAEWGEYATFKKWALSNGYSDGLSLDRIDNNGGYYPENCRWVTMLEQARNTSKTIKIEINGETKCLAEWSRFTGIPRNTLHHRIVFKKMDPALAIQKQG
jgi:hypothetical protein